MDRSRRRGSAIKSAYSKFVGLGINQEGEEKQHTSSLESPRLTGLKYIRLDISNKPSTE
jgi:hypothetical protein